MSRMKRNDIAISQGKAGRCTSENRGRRPMVAEANGNVSTPGMNGLDNHRQQQGSGQSDNPFAFAPLPSTSPATRSNAKSNRRSHRSRSSSGQVSSSTTRTTPASSMAGSKIPGSSVRTPNQQRRQQPQHQQPAHQPQPQEQLIRGILHKRRDHLTYGFSAAWRPRLFILDKTRRRLNYYLLTNTSASSGSIGGDISGSVPTTPVGVNSRQNHTNIDGDDTPSPRTTLQTPQTVQTPAAMDIASPSQMDVTDTRSYDVTPRGMISLRGCVVRAVDDVRTPGAALARSRHGSGSRSSSANDRGGEDNQLFGLVISPQSRRHQDLKNDVHLAATTRSDRDLWLRHLAEACGMVVGPVPGGLVRSVPEPRRVVADTAGSSTTAQAEEEEDGDNDGSDNGGDNSVSADADEAASRNSSSEEEEEEEEQASDKEDETPPRPTIPAAATPTIATTSPLRTTSRRIFDTPAAVVAESEASSSHTSRSTAAMPSRTGSTRTSGIRRQQPVSDINTIQSTKAPPSRFHPPLLHTAATLLAPPIVLRFARLIAPLALLAGALPQLFMFLFLARWSIRTVVQQYYLGRPITSCGGSLHGPVTCRIAVDLRGVLRFIGNKREERTPARLNGSSSSSSNHPVGTTTSHVSVTHIVAKAVATALSEVTPELNCRRVAIPLLGLGGWYTNDAVNVSIVSSSTQHVSTIEEADSLTVQQIADKVWRRQREQRPSNASNNETERVDLESFADNVSHILSLVKTFLASLRPLSSQGTSTRSSCMIFTSPDSENSEVDIEVAPPCSQNEGDPSIIVVVGGVRVVDRDPRNISSEQSRRPMLSIAITIDCSVCNVTACRKFSERIQTLVQFPEMCEQTY